MDTLSRLACVFVCESRTMNETENKPNTKNTSVQSMLAVALWILSTFAVPVLQKLDQKSLNAGQTLLSLQVLQVQVLASIWEPFSGSV